MSPLPPDSSAAATSSRTHASSWPAPRELSPVKRRAAVSHVRKELGVSERRACKALDQGRSTQRWVRIRAERDRALGERMRHLAQENPAYGYRFIWALLRHEGREVKRKRVYRLWKQLGLKVRKPVRMPASKGQSENACHVKAAKQPNDVWTYDFTFDETQDGRTLKFLMVVDEYTRRCLQIEVARSLTGRSVVRVLAELVQIHGEPVALRSDNGPEFVAKAVQAWLGAAGVKTLYVQPGSPWENGYVESFNSRFEHEVLSREVFGGLAEAQVLAEEYRLRYNHVRPHSALGYQTPAQFTAGWMEEHAASAPAALQPSTAPPDGDTENSNSTTALPSCLVQ
jgi:putative transposase